jgi:agmatine/peptidylarginine deiminase
MSRHDVPGRTYVNLFPLNNELHIPVFAKDNKYEEEALAIIAKETGKKIVKHDGDVLAYYSGSIHCITKQIPRGGLFQEAMGKRRFAHRVPSELI